ncbi:MAG TPA: sulfatase-like hydrolase/transferase [Thermoanaerobaculia bacterium]|nr:sulfatase-like hydrolase/transferase [Thermoanaerobaculia bacterium]
MLKRRSHLIRSFCEGLAFVAMLYLAGCSRTETTAAPVASNLVLITLDTVRADRLGCYGYAKAETPWLDRLAQEGVRFAQASAAVPLTLPSHSSLFSGLLPPHHGLRNNGAGSFPEGTPTLATVLSSQGYRTGAFLGAFVLDRRFGLSRGFQTYDDEIERAPGASVVLEAERPGREVMDRALAWLEQEDPRPFFLWVHLYDAHAPYVPPSPQRERHAGRPYDGEIAAVDEQVGRLLKVLESRGLAGSTVVAVASDHGEALGEHGELTHGLLLYEPTLRVPVLLRGPGLPAGRTIETPVSLVDLGPTLAGLLGKSLSAPASGALDGRDLSAGLREGKEPPPSDLYAESQYPAVFGWSPLSALRRRNLKYISSSEPELYDLDRDSREKVNLADISEAQTVEGFAAQLAAIESGAVETQPMSAGVTDAETRARLASLGYLGTGKTASAKAPAAPDRARPAPVKMVDLFQRFERAHNRLGSGRPEDATAALAELEALVTADPRNPVFRGKLAQAWKERGEIGRAVPLYRQAAADAAEDPEAWYNLATALQQSGEIAEAREALEKAMHLDPGRPEAHNTLGIVQLAEGKPDAARQEFELAVRLDPRNAHALNNLGNVLRSLGRPADAEAHYRRAAAAAPRYAEPLNGLGALEVERDRPSAALSFFEQALRLAPRYHEVRLNRAIAYDMAGDTDAAAAAYRDFLAATEQDPQFFEQRRAAQQLLARLSDRATGSAPVERR